jgi:signal transduction histidine kinase
MSTTETQEVQGARVSKRLRLGLAFTGGLVCVASVLMAAGGAESEAAVGRGLLQLLIVGGPIAVGLYALRAPVNQPFGIAMLGIGFLWSLTALGESSQSVPYTIGRISTWLTVPCVFYLLLAFPRGRVEPGLDRAILVGVLGVLVVLFLGTAPFVQAFPPKTLWATCTTDCPANAIFILDEQPAILTKVILVREWLVELLWLGVIYSMFRRWREASPLQRRAMGPAFLAGTLLALLHLAYYTARQLGAPTDMVVALSSAWTLCIVAVCAGFLFGLLWRRMLLAGVLARLGVALRVADDRPYVRHAVATALGDRTAQLISRDAASGSWDEALGDQNDRAVTWIDIGDGRQELALIHDAALLDDPELLDGVRDMILANWRYARLTADLSSALSDLEDSRRRIAEAADVERARIERDLHDGAQQRLIALRIRLGIAEEILAIDPGAGVKELHELGFEAERALEELRSLADGVYPPVLIGRGLGDALHAVAAQAPRPVHVVAVGITRHPVEIESAVYFTCVEAFQNALKHAADATDVWIKLNQRPGRLSFEVSDDGPGFTVDDHDGRGLRSMHDRIEAIGGVVTVDSQLGRGTRVVGSVKLPPTA